MLTAILSAFAGGVILNFMPCVFPILSLKVLAFVRHGDSPRQARIEAIAFTVGVLLSFTALGAVIAGMRLAGVAVGWGFQLQSPIVTSALALVMLATALNLFGMFEVGSSMQSVGQGLTARSDWTGAVLTGVLAVVAASPCVAPFMAGALSYAAVQPPVRSVAVFFTLGVGFAAPFLAVALVPRLASMRPRPGAWMSTLRRLLGVPMLGASIWLAWVLARQAGPTGLACLAAAAMAMALGLSLHGWAQRRKVLGRSSLLLQRTALAAIAIAIVILPLIGRAARARPAAIAVTTPAEPQIWSPERVAAARARGKPIFITFTASWCVTCQVNEQVALSTPQVRAAIRRTGTVYMVADATRFDAKVESAMASFGSGGLPLYVVYPAAGGGPQVLPQILTRGLVVQMLEKAGKARFDYSFRQRERAPWMPKKPI